MPRSYRCRLSLAFLLCIASSVLAQQPSAPPQPQSNTAQPHSATPPEPVDQEQFIPYWTTETGWRSELELRNNLAASDLTVTPALRTLDGTEMPLAPVVIHPQEIKIIDLESAVIDAPRYVGTYGSVILRYHSPSRGNLFPMVMIHNIGHSIAFHIDATSEEQDLQQGSREGIWWLPNDTATDYLLLTNLGSAPLQVDLSLFDSAGREAKQKITLDAKVTSRLSVRQLVHATGLSGTFGGIKIFAPAHAGSLDSLHLLFDEKASLSALMKMFDYNPSTKLEERDYAHTNVWTLRAPMLALSHPDPALAFPEGTVLRPQLFVRNALAKPVNINVRFNWRNASASGKAPGPAFRLGPYETRRVDVGALQTANMLPKDANWASVVLTTSGLPDEVVAVAASYDETLRYGAQTPFSDQLAFHWVGSLWEYDAQHDSLITAGNGGTKPLQAALTIYYNQGTQKYELEQSLQPEEQMWIDVGKLIREHVPDKNGNVLPPILASGSFEFRDLTNKGIGNLFEGKVVYDKIYGHVTYGCGGCCGYNAPYHWYNPLGVPLAAQAGNGVDAYDTCGSYVDDLSSLYWGTWTTGNQSIATVDYYANHTGVAVGATTSAAHASIQRNFRPTCPINPTAPAGNDNVITLTCSPSSLTRGSNATCSVSNAPTGATFSSWKFTDSNNNTVTSGNTGSSWSGIMVTGGAVSVSVSAGGKSTPLSASVTVTNRNWHTAPASPAPVPNNTFATLPVPPQPTGNDSGLGISLERTGNSGFGSTFISSGGPNNGYGYYATQPTFTPLLYQYELNPDLQNSTSTFSQHQCGNYNASSNPSGFISWPNLSTQTSRHEYNSTVQSHYAFYSNSISGANNPGDYAERQIATPGTSASTFDAATSSGLNTLYSNILANFSVQPFAVNESETGVFLGTINYAPYTLCN